MNDKQRIKMLGGVDVVAKHLKFSNQRVFNWTKRGIPSKIKLEYPDIFQSDSPKALKTTTPKR